MSSDTPTARPELSPLLTWREYICLTCEKRTVSGYETFNQSWFCSTCNQWGTAQSVDAFIDAQRAALAAAQAEYKAARGCIAELQKAWHFDVEKRRVAEAALERAQAERDDWRNQRHALEGELFGLLSTALDSPDDVTVIGMTRRLVAEREELAQQVEVLKPGGTYAWKSKAEAAEQRVDRLETVVDLLCIDANRLCDRQLGGTYEEDCRRSIAKADAALAPSSDKETT